MRIGRISFIVLFLLAFLVVPVSAETPSFPYFDTNDAGEPDASVPVLSPWKSFPVNAAYGGIWFVAGDLNGDGAPEVVCAKNFNEGDVHYTSSVAVHRLDGSVLWTWGDPEIGRKELHHDVACQIHDWDGDGRNEVIVLDKDALVELDGRTGKERLRIPIPKQATDSVVFCNLSGDARAETALVKDRYNKIFAYTRDGKLSWSVENPGGYRTAHQPRPMDLDGDGIDEIFAGYAMLNADGTVRWVVQSESVDQKRGHLDCARMMTRGDTPEQTRIAITFCGANNLALVDGNGRIVWEMSGYHFESIDVGRMVPDEPAPQLLVDIDHRPKGESPIWVVGGDGKPLGQIITEYSRQHRLVDWDGDGLDEFAVADAKGLYDHTGKRIATFELPSVSGTIPHVGDLDGDGIPDLIFNSGDAVYIFRNESSKKPARPAPLGTGHNVTLY